jgi:hypothetical protein
MPKFNHYCLRYEGSENGQKLPPTAPPPAAWPQTSIRIFVYQGKTVRVSWNFLEGKFHLKYLSMTQKGF